MKVRVSIGNVLRLPWNRPCSSFREATCCKSTWQSYVTKPCYPQGRFSRRKTPCDYRFQSTIPEDTKDNPTRASGGFQQKLNHDADANHAAIIGDLKSRPDYLIYDNLTANNSHLLNISLADYVPRDCFPNGFSKAALSLPSLESNGPPLLPQGHHLVYFPTQLPASDLLPDGTDTLQFPGAPFTRRLWAGGSLYFGRDELKLDNGRHTCLETIQDVKVRGVPNEEKIFVTTERYYARDGQFQASQGRIDGSDGTSMIESAPSRSNDEIDFRGCSIVERRDLVFLRGRGTLSKPLGEREAPVTRFLQAPTKEPDLMVKLTPSPSLLFRFSALTFNAHLIHLDPSYARNVEGLLDCLVHGPLTLALMLSVLRGRLKIEEMIRSFHYKNLTPLYVNEEMWICVKRSERNLHKHDIWVQTKEGRLAVKGSALVGLKEMKS